MRPAIGKTLRWSSGVIGIALFATVTLVLPAVYRAEYKPVAKPASPLAHARPTAAQNATYLQETQKLAPNPGIALVGRDGYIFLGDIFAANIAQAMGRRYYSPQEILGTAAALRAERTWLAARKIPFAFVVAPAKWDTYGDKLPAWTDGARLPTIYQQMLSYDRSLFVDIRPELHAARSVADTFSRLNSHWTFFGGYVAFQAMVKQLETSYPQFQGLHVPVLSGVRTVNDQNEFTALIKNTSPNNWTEPSFTTPAPGYDLILPNGTRTHESGDHLIDVTQMPLQTQSTTAGNNHRLLILCDSTVTAMSPYLAEAFGSTMMVRHGIDVPQVAPSLPALVESYHPDLVITLMTERNFNFPISDERMWQAADAYDAAVARPEAVSTPSPVRPGVPVPLILPGDITAAAVVRLDTDSPASAQLVVRGTNSAGAVTISVAIAAGHTTTFFRLPDASQWSLVLQSGQGPVTPTAVSAKPTP